MNILKFIKNAEKRWKLFLADYDDLIENANPKPLKIFINSNEGKIDAIKNCSIHILKVWQYQLLV